MNSSLGWGFRRIPEPAEGSRALVCMLFLRGSFVVILVSSFGLALRATAYRLGPILSTFLEAHCLWTRLDFPQDFFLSKWLSTSRLPSDNHLHSGAGHSRIMQCVRLRPFRYSSCCWHYNTIHSKHTQIGDSTRYTHLYELLSAVLARRVIAGPVTPTLNALHPTTAVRTTAIRLNNRARDMVAIP